MMVGKLNFCIYISTMKWNLNVSLYKKKNTKSIRDVKTRPEILNQLRIKLKNKCPEHWPMMKFLLGYDQKNTDNKSKKN